MIDSYFKTGKVDKSTVVEPNPIDLIVDTYLKVLIPLTHMHMELTSMIDNSSVRRARFFKNEEEHNKVYELNNMYENHTLIFSPFVDFIEEQIYCFLKYVFSVVESMEDIKFEDYRFCLIPFDGYSTLRFALRNSPNYYLLEPGIGTPIPKSISKTLPKKEVT